MDIKQDLDIASLARNTRIVAEALGKHIFALNTGKIFSDQLVGLFIFTFARIQFKCLHNLSDLIIFPYQTQGVEENSLQMWIDYLAGMPRSTHLVSHKNHQIITALKDTLAK